MIRRRPSCPVAASEFRDGGQRLHAQPGRTSSRSNAPNAAPPRHARIRRPIELVAAAVHTIAGAVHTTSPDGVRAQRLAERRARQQRRVRRTATSVVVATFVVFGMTAAYGFWSIGGSGAASSSATTFQHLSGTVTGTVTTLLLPGGTADLHMQVTNPNPFQVKITAITQDGPVAVDSTHATAGCSSDTGTWPTLTLGTSGVSVSSGQPPAPVTITATNNTAQSVDLATGASMAAASVSACQGATFSIPVAVTVQQL